MPQVKETIRAGQIEIRFLLESKDSNGQLAMFEFTVPAGAKIPAPHSHTHYDETIYGLDGVLTFTVNGQPVDIAAGDSCFIARGAVHGFNNLKPANAKALAVVTPALTGPEFFRENGGPHQCRWPAGSGENQSGDDQARACSRSAAEIAGAPDAGGDVSPS